MVEEKERRVKVVKSLCKFCAHSKAFIKKGKMVCSKCGR